MSKKNRDQKKATRTEHKKRVDEQNKKVEAKREWRTRAELMDYINSKVPYGELRIPSSLDKALRLIPTGSLSGRHGLHEISRLEAMQMQEFCRMVEIMESSVLILKEKATDELLLIRPKKSSRYFEDGREKIKDKVNKRFGKKSGYRGVFVTMTYDPSKVGRAEAWEKVGAHISNFIEKLNKTRQRSGKVKKNPKTGKYRRLSYVWVIEEQKGTGYPHVHMFFPKLKWLLDKRDVWGLWGFGGVDVKGGAANVSKYILKYIGKFNGMSLLALSYIWKFKRRLYGNSRDVEYKKIKDNEEIQEPKYEVFGMWNKKKGFGEFNKEAGAYNWVGAVPMAWALGVVEIRGSSSDVEYLRGVMW